MTEAPETRTCPECGAQFTPKDNEQVFCCIDCAEDYHYQPEDDDDTHP